MQTQRKSNVELLRIVAILLIIFSHFSRHGFMVLFDDLDMIPGTINRVFLRSTYLGNLGSVIFVIISGYFLCNSKKVTLRKLLSMVIQVWTYSMLGYLICGLYLQGISFSIKDFFVALTPLIHKVSWFFSCYILLYIIHPYLNMVIRNLNKDEYIKLLIVSLLLWSFIPVIFHISFYDNDLIQFILFYFIGAYLRVYDPQIKPLYVCIGVVSMFVMWCGLHLLLELLSVSSYIKDVSLLLADKNSPFVILTAVLICYVFLKANLKYNPLINEMASCVGGIYLIHDNPYVRKIIFNDIFQLEGIVNSSYLPFWVSGFVLIVFVSCYFVEKTRKCIYNKCESIF